MVAYSTMTETWKMALGKVDIIMPDVAIWKPITEEEVELDTWKIWTL
jgi:hypothetical protein